jgi:surface protein
MSGRSADAASRLCRVAAQEIRTDIVRAAFAIKGPAKEKGGSPPLTKLFLMGKDILRAFAGRTHSDGARAETLRARLAEKWRGLSAAEQFALGGTLAVAIAGGGFWLNSLRNESKASSATAGSDGGAIADGVPSFRTQETEDLLELHKKSEGQKKENIAEFCACRIHDVRDRLLDEKYVKSATEVLQFHIDRLYKVERHVCEGNQLRFLENALRDEVPLNFSGGVRSVHMAPPVYADEVNRILIPEGPGWGPKVPPCDWDAGLKGGKRAEWALEKITTLPDLHVNCALYHDEYGHISTWDVRGVKSMNRAFADADPKICDHIADMSFWDTREVVDMSGMFSGAHEFDGDIKNWDTRMVRNMSRMFSGAKRFNQNIGKWDTGEVTNMRNMFRGAERFSHDLHWNTANVEDMCEMFRAGNNSGPYAFDGALIRWETGKVANMRGMFAGAAKFDQDIGKWETGKVATMNGMFAGAAKFDQDIGKWDTREVGNMAEMVANATSFSQDLKEWKTGSVTDMEAMFYHAESFNADIRGWDTKNVTDMNRMFNGATKFDRDLSGWVVTAVVAHDEVFAGSGMTAHAKRPKFNLFDFGRARQAQAAQRGYV